MKEDKSSPPFIAGQTVICKDAPGHNPFLVNGNLYYLNCVYWDGSNWLVGIDGDPWHSGSGHPWFASRFVATSEAIEEAVPEEEPNEFWAMLNKVA